MQIFSVSQFIDLLNETLRQTVSGEEIAVEGEVSDFKISQGKWVRFDLKDEEEEALLKCFMTIYQLGVELEDGMRIRVHGVPKVYPRYGQLSMNVSRVELVGEGALRRAYELMFKKLEAEGLFAPERKRALPRFPERIGLITSREAAAYTDFLRILNDRWSGVEVIHGHVQVQGEKAIKDIVGSFMFYNSLPEEDRPEVIVLTRGGGGLEDLIAFNSEAVARAVFSSKIPVVCGVGHERDESLADYVADVRAATPTNAAEIVVPDQVMILDNVDSSVSSIQHHLAREIQNLTMGIDGAVRIIHGYLTDQIQRFQGTLHAFGRQIVVFKSRVAQSGQSVSSMIGLVSTTYRETMARVRERIALTLRLLKNLDPETLLKRGYSIVFSNGRILKDAETVDKGDRVEVKLWNGRLKTEVIQKLKNSSKPRQSKLKI